MVLLRCGAVALLLLVMACSGASRMSRSLSDASGVRDQNVLSHVELPMLPALEGRLDDAQHAATAVVLGIRRVEDVCGTYFDLRMFPEVQLGGSEVLEPRDLEESIELRALMYMPNPKGTCDEPRAHVVETNVYAFFRAERRRLIAEPRARAAKLNPMA